MAGVVDVVVVDVVGVVVGVDDGTVVLDPGTVELPGFVFGFGTTLCIGGLGFG